MGVDGEKVFLAHRSAGTLELEAGNVRVLGNLSVEGSFDAHSSPLETQLQCLKGQFFDTESVQCHDCPSGKYNLAGAQRECSTHDVQQCLSGALASRSLCRKADGTWFGSVFTETYIDSLDLAGVLALGTNTESCVSGYEHSLCKKTDGTWVGFGSNIYGQLGLGDTTSRNTPTAVLALGTDTESCVCGYYHSLCRKTDGTWVSFGSNSFACPSCDCVGTWSVAENVCTSMYTSTSGTFNNEGLLGLGDTTSRTTPTLVTALGTDTESCVSGSSFSLCRKTDGTWVGFGSNYYGQLGLGVITESENTPTPVTALGTDTESCVCGPKHSLCRKTDGTWVSFGSNSRCSYEPGPLGAVFQYPGPMGCQSTGLLGLGDALTDTYYSTPTAMTALGTDTESCVCGYEHSLCRKTDGTWVGFGSNSYGQLGLGDTTSRNTPTAITALGTDTESCVCSTRHSLCKKSGIARCQWVGFGNDPSSDVNTGVLVPNRVLSLCS
jgi:alpha-tubulin suppressor-like RCC1 family protein